MYQYGRDHKASGESVTFTCFFPKRILRLMSRREEALDGRVIDSRGKAGIERAENDSFLGRRRGGGD